jgi:hypothetical protein
MTRLKAIAATVLILGSAASTSAFAHGVRFGFAFGFPIYPAPYYYPPPAYYYPPPVYVAPAPAPVYVEAPQMQAAPPQAQAAPQPEYFWYYCPDSKTYYPYGGNHGFSSEAFTGACGGAACRR